MKTFKDLVFTMVSAGMKQAIMRFPNGYGVSVLRGDGALSDPSHPYEIAVIMFKNDGGFTVIYPEFCDGDVLSFKTESEVNRYMWLTQELAPESVEAP